MQEAFCGVSIREKENDFNAHGHLRRKKEAESIGGFEGCGDKRTGVAKTRIETPEPGLMFAILLS